VTYHFGLALMHVRHDPHLANGLATNLHIYLVNMDCKESR
jgi:hypothetical protein